MAWHSQYCAINSAVITVHENEKACTSNLAYISRDILSFILSFFILSFILSLLSASLKSRGRKKLSTWKFKCQVGQ